MVDFFYFNCILAVGRMSVFCVSSLRFMGLVSDLGCDRSWLYTMRGSRKFCQRGSNFFSFLVDDGREDPYTTIRGPLWAGVPMIAQH